ncbi:MAG TPA: type II toxin-antitoxin system VapC family toxin [Rubrivivax sp.]|nr:type II toxin-antitoxin system VapC family toxin [Rubrivivax sp.]
MLLVDSNIVFSLLVHSMPWHRAARELHDLDKVWRTESHALVEISNVLSRYVRARELSSAKAIDLMNEADRRMRPRLLTVDHVEALRVALKHNVSAYDARFLLCAVDLGTRLTTEDVKLRKAAPSLTQSLDDALAAAQA